MSIEDTQVCWDMEGRNVVGKGFALLGSGRPDEVSKELRQGKSLKLMLVSFFVSDIHSSLDYQVFTRVRDGENARTKLMFVSAMLFCVYYKVIPSSM